jgi:hypothetical protein
MSDILLADETLMFPAVAGDARTSAAIFAVRPFRSGEGMEKAMEALSVQMLNGLGRPLYPAMR